LPPQHAPSGLVQKPPLHVEWTPNFGTQTVAALAVVQAVEVISWSGSQ
jgi:hypothetical protein